MLINFLKNTVLFPIIIGILVPIAIGMNSCGSGNKSEDGLRKSEEMLRQAQHDMEETIYNEIIEGANQTITYLPFLTGKKVGIVANQTSIIYRESRIKNQESRHFTHLVDSLISMKVNVIKVFAPEHGFRGKADAGEHIKDGVDLKTGIPIISLYGKQKKPNSSQLKDIEIMIFDIQDVGARFYTYISTLHYVMEACAESEIPVLILDRPNPNGHYIDGPILEPEHKSFVGMHPVPVVHGMTIGEYAQMINGEKWLANGIQCDITVIPVKNYTHQTAYSLPIKPSPNLPNDVAINLYPSLCFFEGTNVSAGRGTDKQFQIFGSPFLVRNMFPYNYEFTPQPNEGAKYPKHEGKLCFGMDLSKTGRLNRLDLNYLIEAYQATDNKEEFFNDFFTKLAGTKKLQEQIEGGHTAYELKKNWVRGLQTYDVMRKAYMIYE